MGWDIFPEGIYHVLLELKRFKKPVFIAEAGIADKDDIYRGQYIKDLVYWTHRAILDDVPVKGFLYWSLTDNFEWAKGYDQRFGLIEIDYNTKKRTVRDSAYIYKEICENNSLTIH
jgi:beta-glucosidase/6-phospho-beta-glucosidase/beta-galactosidase